MSLKYSPLKCELFVCIQVRVVCLHLAPRCELFVCGGNFGKPLDFSKVSDARSRDSARVPKNAEETPGTSKAAKRTNAPAKTVTWTRLLNFTAGRRTHTMACAHSELSTGHCGRRIGTKIFQDDSCSPSTCPGAGSLALARAT